MKLLMIGIVFAAAACSTTTPTSSVSSAREDQRKALTKQCMKAPERFGFANTRAQNVDAMSVNPGFAPNVYSHCSRVARHILK